MQEAFLLLGNLPVILTARKTPHFRRAAPIRYTRVTMRHRKQRFPWHFPTIPKSKLKLWLAWGTGFISALGLVFCLTLWMATSVYSKLPSPANLGPGFQKVDAIVCLAGGRGRIRRALELFDRGVSDHLYISGTERGVRMKGILRELGWVGPIEDSSHITIEDVSTNTIENAREVSKFLERTNRKSILLVTSIYHVRRAYYIFKHTLPADVAISVSWYEREPFEPGDWWKSLNGIWVTVGEFFKFYWVYIRI